MQGSVESAEVLRLLRAVLDAGVDRVGLADTVGYADPLDGRRACSSKRCRSPATACTAAISTTRADSAWPTCYAAWQTGITRFDACLAGIGGCPHAPGASGNVATEDVVYMFASMGVATGQDFDRLIALRAKVAQWLEGETLHGSLWRAGLPKTMLATTRMSRSETTPRRRSH